MTSADQYRKLAAELRAAAADSANRGVAAQLQQLAQSYIRLAEQADKNRLADIAVEFGKKPTQQGEGT